MFDRCYLDIPKAYGMARKLERNPTDMSEPDDDEAHHADTQKFSKETAPTTRDLVCRESFQDLTICYEIQIESIFDRLTCAKIEIQ